MCPSRPFFGSGVSLKAKPDAGSNFPSIKGRKVRNAISLATCFESGKPPATIKEVAN